MSAICTHIHSAWINLLLLGLFCLVERWLSAHLSFRLKIIFMQNSRQDRFGFMSVWSHVKTALVTHLCRRWKDFLIALLTFRTYCYWAFLEVFFGVVKVSKNHINTVYKLRWKYSEKKQRENCTRKSLNWFQFASLKCAMKWLIYSLEEAKLEYYAFPHLDKHWGQVSQGLEKQKS